MNDLISAEERSALLAPMDYVGQMENDLAREIARWHGQLDEKKPAEVDAAVRECGEEEQRP